MANKRKTNNCCGNNCGTSGDKQGCEKMLFLLFLPPIFIALSYLMGVFISGYSGIAINGVSMSTMPITLQPNQELYNIGRGWERVVINKNQTNFLNATMSNAVAYVNHCSLFIFSSNTTNMTTSSAGSITRIIEFPTVLNSTNPLSCESAIFGGEEILNLNTSQALQSVNSYDSEWGAEWRVG